MIYKCELHETETKSKVRPNMDGDGTKDGIRYLSEWIIRQCGKYKNAQDPFIVSQPRFRGLEEMEWTISQILSI